MKELSYNLPKKKKKLFLEKNFDNDSIQVT